jgi:hypothetical protein
MRSRRCYDGRRAAFRSGNIDAIALRFMFDGSRKGKIEGGARHATIAGQGPFR